MATPNTPSNPGFVQAPPMPYEQAQTFRTPSFGAAQTFNVPSVPTGGGFMGSLAPTGPGQPATSTVSSPSSTRGGGSDIPYGALAGAGALAAGLAAYGDEGDGLSFGNMLSGAKKIYELADISDIDIIGKLPQELQNAVKSITDAPGNLYDSLFGADAVPIGELGSATSAQAIATGNAMIKSGAAAALEGTPSLYAPTTMGMGSIPSISTPTAQAAAVYGGGPQLTAATTGALPTTGLGGGAGMAAFAGPAAIAGIAMLFKGHFDKGHDPTADTRTANELENYFQRAVQSPEQERLELENLRKLVFVNPNIINIMKHAARTADPNIEHTSGGTETVGWKGGVPAMFEKLLPELEKVAFESSKANEMYNIGDEGLSGAPPNPYGENTRTLDKETGEWKARPPVVDSGAVELGHTQFPRFSSSAPPPAVGTSEWYDAGYGDGG